jgi:hypothetical protein
VQLGVNKFCRIGCNSVLAIIKFDSQHKVSVWICKKKFKNTMYGIIFKDKGRLKCHWVPIGAIGQEGIDGTIRPHSSSGVRVLHFSLHGFAKLLVWSTKMSLVLA